MPDETLLAFDFGVRRIGVALGNTLTGTARALEVFDSTPEVQRFTHIEGLIRTWQPQRLVVGRPLNEDGSESDTTRRAQRFCNQLRGRFGLPVETVDERFSSREAQAIIEDRAQSMPRSRRPREDDAVAAAVILEQYLGGLGPRS
jgi:putative Holliday junction resolvase